MQTVDLGRYLSHQLPKFCFNKIPLEIFSGPDHFQKHTSRILTGLIGVVCQMDDVVVFGSNKAEHNSQLLAVFKNHSICIN